MINWTPMDRIATDLSDADIIDFGRVMRVLVCRLKAESVPERLFLEEYCFGQADQIEMLATIDGFARLFATERARLSC